MGDPSRRIADVTAYPASFPTTARARIRLGIGEFVRRDTVIVKVTTSDGITGWGESYHGRSPAAVAALVNGTLRDLVVGRRADDVVGAWDRLYRTQLASHGMGAGSAIAYSGIDMALWDIRGKAVGLPLYRLLGGGDREIVAYAGGVALGFGPPEQLIDDIRPLAAAGFTAVKVRVGDSVAQDLARVAAVRAEFGPELTIMVDANAAYTLDQVRAVMPGLVEHGVRWLEEPFPAHDYRNYAAAAALRGVALAAGENHHTRSEFRELLDAGSVEVLQPDISKSGGITEVLRIAQAASLWRIRVHPHTSTSGLNMAASVHLLAAIDNGGFFEADVSHDNHFRDELTSRPFQVSAAGTVRPLAAPGIGVELDEQALARYQVVEGSGIAS